MSGSSKELEPVCEKAIPINTINNIAEQPVKMKSEANNNYGAISDNSITMRSINNEGSQTIQVNSQKGDTKVNESPSEIFNTDDD